MEPGPAEPPAVHSPSLPPSPLGAMLGEDAALAAPAAKPAGLSAGIRARIKELEQIEFGTWFEFGTGAQARAAKLSWFSPTTHNYMFVDSGGQRVAIKPIALLASEIEQGLARIIPAAQSTPLMDRALSTIYRVLQRLTGRGGETD